MATVSLGLKADKASGDPDHTTRLNYLKHARDLNRDRLDFLVRVEAILNRTLAHESEGRRQPQGVGGDPYMTLAAKAEIERKKAAK